MTQTAQVAALVVTAVNVLAGAVGGWRWWTVEPSRAFWVLCRAGQAVAIGQALVAGVLWLQGLTPGGGLYWLYALLPVAVSFVAEQLRVTSAQTVLDARGLEDAQAVGRLAEQDQRSVVTAIMRREMGVMALSALAIAFLALRAYGTV